MIDENKFHETYETNIEPLLEIALRETERVCANQKEPRIPCVWGGCDYISSWEVISREQVNEGDPSDYLCDYHKAYWEEAMRFTAPHRLKNFDIIPIAKVVKQ